MAQLVPVDTFDLIIIGGSGDLALRKLLPALYHRNCDQQITAESRIIAVSRAEMTRDEYVDSVRAALPAPSPQPSCSHLTPLSWGEDGAR